jgi:hypothetical protein
MFSFDQDGDHDGDRDGSAGHLFLDPSTGERLNH